MEQNIKFSVSSVFLNFDRFSPDDLLIQKGSYEQVIINSGDMGPEKILRGHQKFA